MKKILSMLLFIAVVIMGGVAEAQQTEKTRVIGILSLSTSPRCGMQHFSADYANWSRQKGV